MGQTVLVKSGEQVRNFEFGYFVGPHVYNALAPGASLNSLPLYKESPWGTFQAIVDGTGAGTGSVTIQVTNDDDTGRGYVGPGQNQPDYAVSTQLSTTLLSPGGMFEQKLVGAVIVGLGIPLTVPTTVVTVAADGKSLVMSAAATIAAAGVQARFFDTDWCATPLSPTIVIATAGGGTDGFACLAAPWRYVRAVVSAITGGTTGVSANMGV